MTAVWDVAPHPDATEREGPGAFREHDIRPFPGGMTPVSWPLIASEMTATRGPDGQWRSSRNWVDDYLVRRYRRTDS